MAGFIENYRMLGTRDFFKKFPSFVLVRWETQEQKFIRWKTADRKRGGDGRCSRDWHNACWTSAIGLQTSIDYLLVAEVRSQ